MLDFRSPIYRQKNENSSLLDNRENIINLILREAIRRRSTITSVEMSTLVNSVQNIGELQDENKKLKE